LRTRRIGSLEVSVVGLGCNNFGSRLDVTQTAAVVHGALDAGVTFFDTADIYGATRSEEFLGRALASRREEVVVATKFGGPIDEHRGGATPGYVHQAIDASLRRLSTDHIDLYQLHFPDPRTPIADTLEALADVVRMGKVREIGCSNFSAEQLRAAEASVTEGGARFVSVQNEFSLLHRDPEDDVLEVCRELDLTFLPYFPLASGLLSGKYRRGHPAPAGTRLSTMTPERRDSAMSDTRMAKVEALASLAQQWDHSLVELAVAWLLAHSEVASVIAGATSADQVRANVAAAGWTLDAAALAAIDQAAPASRA
jgi:aryl-alcohol dehydrogenase-like predicted oxidoreductase